MLKTFFKQYFIFCLLGLFVGLLFPIVFAFLDLYQLSIPMNRESLWFVVSSQNIYLFSFISFPLLFAFIAFVIRGLYLATRIIKREQKKAIINSKMASLGVLSAGVGHEINNPLGIIQGNLEMLKIGLEKTDLDKEKLFKRVDTSLEAIVGISKIVNGLKSVARSSFENNLDLYSLNIHEVIEKIVGMLESVYANEGIDFKLQLNADNPYVLGDSGSLQQVFLNLFSNAKDAILEKKALDDSFLDYFINVVTETHNEKIHIFVKDYGVGIKTKNFDQVFDSFFTTKDVNKGVGLGLSITRNLVNKMNGSIDFTSRSRKGTTFNLILPASTEVTASDSTSTSDNRVESNKDYQGNELLGRKILLAEDDLSYNEILLDILSSCGAQVVSVYDGEQALQVIGEMKDIDLLITDLQMPNLNGEKLIQKIRGSENHKNLPILVITGGIQSQYLESEHEKIISLVQGYISKPFGRNKFVIQVKSILSHS